MADGASRTAVDRPARRGARHGTHRTLMRRSPSLPLPPPSEKSRRARGDWHTVRTLLPYLLAYKGRVLLALACLVAAKLANVGVPLVLKQIVDRLTAPAELVLPLALLAAYG